MIMIPKSVVYFILGFISAYVVLIIVGIIISKKQAKQKQMIFDKFLESLNNKDDEE